MTSGTKDHDHGGERGGRRGIGVRGWTIIAVCPILLLLFYLLSLVPVLMMYYSIWPNGQGSPRWLDSVLEHLYTPLFWAIEEFDWLERFYMWYGGLFGMP